MSYTFLFCFLCSSRRRHTRCALVTGVQTCALPIFQIRAEEKQEIWTRLETVLRARAQRWALTGADAAERRTHFFRAEETEIYAPTREIGRASCRERVCPYV